MALVAASVRAHRPLAEVVTISVLFFLGVTASTYGAIALALLLLPFLPSMRQDLRVR